MNPFQSKISSNVEVLILGGGPAGLTAAYALLQQGRSVTLVEKASEVGGLMRTVKYENFAVDYGYKHLYSRIPDVQRLWENLLGADFLPYQPRVGILYKGYILERERVFRGLRRGMPYWLLASSFFDWLKYGFFLRNKAIPTLEDFAYASRGQKFTRIFTQEFDERFKGRKWSELPAPKPVEKKPVWRRFFSDAIKSHEKQVKWFHPALGTGQIIDRLREAVLEMGGTIVTDCQVLHVTHTANKIGTVRLRQGGATVDCTPKILISSLLPEILAPMMGISVAPKENEYSFGRGVVLVYLFLNREVAFPHTSLHVSCPEIRMSRVTNYGAYPGRMVPLGKACLCLEYFTDAATDLLGKTNQEIYELAVGECEKSNLIDPNSCIDFRVIKNANADPAASWEDYKTDPSRMKLYDQINQISNLYQINRTGTDKSTYAGLMASKAILCEDKSVFEVATKPDVFAPWEP